MTEDDLDAWAATCGELARAAGRTMSRWARTGGDVTTKADRSPVTAADVEVNRHVVDLVTSRFGHRVLGEEESSGSGDGPVWVVDPVDGTLPFTLGVPVSCFSVAVVVDGAPVVAVCSEPWTGRVWRAVTGRGTTRDGRPVHVNAERTLAGCLVGATGPDQLADTAQLTAALVRRARRVLVLGTTVGEAARVADGGLGATVFTEPTPWDVAATALLVAEAGGRVTDLRGEPQRYDGPTGGALFSNGAVHDELAALVAPHLRG